MAGAVPELDVAPQMPDNPEALPQLLLLLPLQLFVDADFPFVTFCQPPVGAGFLIEFVLLLLLSVLPAMLPGNPIFSKVSSIVVLV